MNYTDFAGQVILNMKCSFKKILPMSRHRTYRHLYNFLVYTGKWTL